MDRVLGVNAVDHVVVIKEVLFSRLPFQILVNTNAGKGLLIKRFAFLFFWLEVGDRLGLGFMNVEPGLCFGGCELSTLKDFVWDEDLSLEI